MKQLTVLILFTPLFLPAQYNIALLDTDIKSTTVSPRSFNTQSTIPFEVVRGMMHVRAKLENREGTFILDTGAPMLIINCSKTYTTKKQATSISNSFEVATFKVEKFNWGAYSNSEFEALAIDISHIEKAAKRPILGIIGYSNLKDYEVYINPLSQKIHLHPSENNNLHKVAKPLLAIPFNLQDHLPVLSIEIGGKQLNLGLDTGAAVNLLNAQLLEQLPPDLLSNREVEEVVGIDQNIIKTTSSLIPYTNLANQTLGEMKYIFTDIDHLNQSTELQIDGILGFPFIQKLKCSINYKKQILYIWEVL